MRNSILLVRQSSRVPVLLAFMLGHLTHHVSTAAMIPLLPMMRDSLQMDYLRAGMLLSAFSISYGFAQLPTAWLADRVSGRKVVSLGLLATGLGCIGVGLSHDYTQVFLCFMVMGMAGSTYHAPSSSFLSQTFDRESRGRSLGVHTAAGTVGLMVAPVLAILTANLSGDWRNSFLLMGCPAILAGALLWVVARHQDGTNRKAVTKEKAEPLNPRQLLRALGLLMGIAILTQLVTSAMNSFLPLFLTDKHGVSNDYAGLMMMVVYGAGVIGGPAGGAISDRIGRKPVILSSIVMIGVMLFFVTSLPFGPLMIGAVAIYGASMCFRLPAMESHVADLVPARRRATVLGGYYFLSQETQGISTPLVGWMLDQFGIENGFHYLAYFALACSALVLLIRKRV